MFRICKTMRFEAAHILRNKDTTDEENEKLFGKCSTLHGHSYKVEVFIKGEELHNGMLMNFSEVKDILRTKVIDKFDHKTLNQCMEVIPTAENIAKIIYEKIKGTIYFQQHKHYMEIEKIRVWETDTCWAEYYE